MILPALVLSGCVQSPAEPALPPLCPGTSNPQEVNQMAEMLRGRKESAVIAHYGPPAQRNHDAEIAMDILAWGPQRIAYRRDNGQTVPHNCMVEMYATGGIIARAVWQLTPPE